MTLYQAIDSRFSCRAYREKPLEKDVLQSLSAMIDAINAESGLRFQLYGPREGHPSALDLAPAMFPTPVPCYAALVAPSDSLSGDRVGYYGERLVLEATAMGLGTCWVGGTFDRKTVRVDLREGEALWDVVPIGYPAEKVPVRQRMIRAALRARDHKPSQLVESETPYDGLPEWFRAGIEAVVKGPSAVNKQPVIFTWREGRITARLRSDRLAIAFNDLGIARLHFELAAAAHGVVGRWETGEEDHFIYD